MVNLEKAILAVQSGGVVLLPTDTVLGLAARPSDAQAVARLYHLKARPAARQMPVMIADRAQVEGLGLCRTPILDRLLASNLLPGALTLAARIDPARAPDWLRSRREVAFRLPDDPFLRDVLRATGPLYVTSANHHGAPTPLTTEDAAAQLTAPPDFVVPGRGASDLPSTLVNCAGTRAVIEREGAISRAAIAQIVELADG